MADITVEVDGLPVDVDADLYAAEPNLVIERVRANRADFRLPPLEDDEREPDYTTLHGEDA